MLRCPRKGSALHLSFLLLPLTALLFLAVAVIGTDRLGRPLTDEEKKRFGALLREHDYPGMRLVALQFGYKLTRSRQRAEDLMGRADVRLVRFGWDPAEVPLKRRLCRLVWSEWTNEASETETTRKAEEAFLRELEATGRMKLVVPPLPEEGQTPGPDDQPQWATPSHVERAVAVETAMDARTKASVKLEKLRAMFAKAGDEVNLLWLKFELEDDITEPLQMAAKSGRPVADFHAAKKRRTRAVQRLLANDRGVEWVDDDS